MRERCPKAPNKIVAARLPKRKPGRKIPHIYLPDDPAIHNSTKPQDRQINPSARTTRMEDGSFRVEDVLRLGGSWTCQLSTECPYCHRTITVRANGPANMAQYARDEACRLALLEHLRTDHVSSSAKRKSVSSTTATKTLDGSQTLPIKTLKDGTVLVGSETGHASYFSVLIKEGPRGRRKSSSSAAPSQQSFHGASVDSKFVICPVCDVWFRRYQFGSHVRLKHPASATESWMNGY